LFEETGNSAIVDEWTFGLYQNPIVAQAKLTEHWDTWITESDFEAIAAAGCVFGCIGALQCAASFESNAVIV
jgi:aryl-phospho-beta-D-glucosidase BglC (GH1 family)